MKCPRCGYAWEPKIPQPKECPRCKGRLDYRPVGASRIRTEKKEMEKKITSKLPWAAVATIIVVVVGLGAWALLGQAPAGTATITAVAGQGVVFAGGIPTGTASGIENVYIIAHGTYTKTENLSGNSNILGVIEANTGSVNIPYGTSFDIVVAVKVGTDNMAYVNVDNMNVSLAVSGSFSITEENTTDKNLFENSGYGTATGWVRVNAVWDNNGNGYTLSAGGSITLDPIKLWGWK
ncbi:MAG: hypothetical protein E3J91_01670 [Hadesarchaea archaeon]|nr:MAG: hypothetical protein E3J91_01670 [Hadesarchaea archaeon]